jgi:hypothetical protein
MNVVCMYVYSLSFVRMWTEKKDQKELYFRNEGVYQLHKLLCYHHPCKQLFSATNLDKLDHCSNSQGTTLEKICKLIK